MNRQTIFYLLKIIKNKVKISRFSLLIRTLAKTGFKTYFF